MKREDGLSDQSPPYENVIAGIVGAFLFALAGGAVYFLLNQIGFLAGISGLVAVVCAAKGYQIFAKRESKKGVVISVIAALLVIVLSWYCCLALDLYKAYQEWYAAGEVDFTVTYFEALRGAYRFLKEPEIARPYFSDLIMGLGLCFAGSVGYIINSFRRVKTGNTVPQSPLLRGAYPPAGKTETDDENREP